MAAFVRDGEALTALRPAASENDAAVLGGHARAEPMGAAAANLAGLIGALHGNELLRGVGRVLLREDSARCQAVRWIPSRIFRETEWR